MTQPETPEEPALTEGNLVARYRAMWDSPSEIPDVFAFLAETPSASSGEQLALVQADQEERAKRNCRISLEDYCRQLPKLASKTDYLEHWIATDLELRRETGDDPDAADYTRRFPHLRSKIHSLFMADSTGNANHSDTDSHDSPEDLFASEPNVGDPQTEQIKRPSVEPNPRANGVLASSPCFQELPGDVVELLESRMESRSYSDDECLICQGDAGDSLIVIVEGDVQISTEDNHGYEYLIEVVGPGDVIGEMALLSEEPRTANATAMGDVQTLELDVETFQELIRQYPAISIVLTHLVATRLGGDGRDVLASKVYDRYRIHQRLGKGGMAVVYSGEELQTGQRVAIKMMSHRLVYEADALEQFQLEADIIERFDHENIIRMHGRFAAFHTYFLVMHYCDGITLSELLRQTGPLDEPTTKRILGQVVAGLNYAHQEGVIHRDVKPANIMLERNGVVKLMDFGLAKPVEDHGQTLSGTIVGTPRYMAPEQMAGLHIDPNVDYFALGAVAYELLIGEKLFNENSVMDILRRHVRWKVPQLQELRPHLSDELSTVIETWLAKDPFDRAFDVEAVIAWGAD